MDTSDLIITDKVLAYTIVPGDQVLIEGDPVEVKDVDDNRPDPDEILFIGYSHESGDRVEYAVYYGDWFELWAI